MKFRNIQVIVLTAIFVITATVSAHAGSMLTESSDVASDGLLIVDENVDEDINLENMNNDVLYFTLKKQVDKIWGPEIVKKKMAEAEKETTKMTNSKYPPIMVKHKIKVASAGSYKYKHTYSSRHKGSGGKVINGYQINYINITPVIIEEAQRNGISPVLLKAVIQTESTFNNYAVSYVGARGLCQLMPTTARMLGVRDPHDPVQNIKGGAKYLGKLKKMFKSTDLILAAYNAGPGCVKRSGGVPNIYETRRFIQKVRKNMKW